MRPMWYRVGPVLLVTATVAGMVGGCEPRESSPASKADTRATASPTSPASPTISTTGLPDSRYDPARFAPQVRIHAAAAGVAPQLLMAILYNESYKPHDPKTERAWHRLKPDCAFGIANMHEAAFLEARQGRDFANRDWHELPDDPDLAIVAAAWHLHDLAAQLPASWVDGYTRDELTALGYNAGAGNMLAFAQGATPGRVAREYLDKLRGNWEIAAKALS